ncbi:MAG: ABC transporter permease [Deltaproteobacteria bacterium]|nr:ABC transporter permease [Deltaproteobacteria bacterium]
MLFQPRSRAAVVAELAAIPGVLQVDATRVVPVRLRAAAPESSSSSDPSIWEGAIEARSANSQLRIALDRKARLLPRLPDDGVVLTRELAQRLRVSVGGEVVVERLDARHAFGAEWLPRLRVASLSEDMLGLHAVVDLGCADRLFGDGDIATGALLLIDPAFVTDVGERIKALPAVAGFALRSTTIASFERILAESTSITRSVLALLSSLLALGIVYNTSRIALAERARELATLRVLGFTLREVSRLFIGEQLLVVVVAIPAGWLAGRLLAELLMRTIASSDLFRLDVVTLPATLLFSSVIVASAAAATSILVQRRIARLDLIAVLKARE